jgi:hypothetical protein
MFCDRCGVLNPSGRTLCLHCLGALKPGAGEAVATCAEHPAEPATGRCVTCGKLVCEACGGVVSNRGVYCIDHTPSVTTTASASPGMNPFLAGGGGAEAAAATTRAKASMDRGMLAAILGIVLILVYFGVAFGFPGPLRSKELPASQITSYGGGGSYGGSSYGMPGGGYPGGPGGGYGGGPGGPGGGYPGGPGGSGGYSTGVESGGPFGSGAPGGPPGGPPGAPGGSGYSPYPGGGGYK